MKRGHTGKIKKIGRGPNAFGAFVPAPLPPVPPLVFDRLFKQSEAASQALGRLDGISQVLPDTGLFLYLYVRKEALLSSQIEGTQSSFSELLLFEEESLPKDRELDAMDVSNYIDALQHGVKRVREEFPISVRLLREIHQRLLRSGRGTDQEPGEIRRSQNWIGGSRPGNAAYVPPPIEDLDKCLSDFEKFIHTDPTPLPILIKVGLLHVQFESIHPFLDGNGRLGRLLITLYLCERKVLAEPILFLSLYLKNNRDRYYDLLQRVRSEGVWEEWLEFFLEGLRLTADQAVDTARRTLKLFTEDRGKIGDLARAAPTTIMVHDLLKERIVTSVPRASERLGISQPTTRAAIANLEALGIAKEISGKKRGKIFSYSAFLKILSEGTEPLPPMR